jgi:hypothetical protein
VVVQADMSDTSVIAVKPTTSRLTIAVQVSVACLHRQPLTLRGAQDEDQLTQSNLLDETLAQSPLTFCSGVPVGFDGA